MLSLSILAPLQIAALLTTAYATAWIARAVGSVRGRFAVACISILLLFLLQLMLLAIFNRLAEAGQSDLWQVAGLATFVAAAYLQFKSTFRLSSGKAFAPLAAYVGTLLVWACLMLLVVKPHVTEAFVIPTSSMSPTIEPRDRITVNRLLHPRRFDLIAYHSNERGHPIFCKRLVGLPGERLRFENGQLYVDDKVVTLPAVVAGSYHAGVMHNGAPVSGMRNLYHDGETIPLGRSDYFVIGDNVDISFDSRLAGPSDASSIVGVVDCIYWPLSRFRIVR
jgi:signal peptidase I